MQSILLNHDYIKKLLKPRSKTANKGDFGKLLSVVSSQNYSGAAILSAQSALRCGVGICTVASIPTVLLPLRVRLPEAITLTLKEQNGAISFQNAALLISESEKYSAMLLGCGLSLCEDTKRLVYSLISNTDLPLLIDADGINALSLNIDILKSRTGETVITPHIKEMSRLTGLSVNQIKNQPQKVALDFAKKHRVTVVLKDFYSYIATPSGNIYQNIGGHPCMAKGGSGDMLSGMIASFMAQGYSAEDASVSGVYIHSQTGAICQKKFGDFSVLTSDLISALSEVFCSF